MSTRHDVVLMSRHCRIARASSRAATKRPRLRTVGRGVRRFGPLPAGFGRKVPILRTVPPTARKFGTLPAILVHKVPILRTVPPSVRRFGTLPAILGRKVPFLRTAGPSVRRFGTLRRLTATDGDARPCLGQSAIAEKGASRRRKGPKSVLNSCAKRPGVEWSHGGGQ